MGLRGSGVVNAACTRLHRRDDGTWRCRCGWTGPDPYTHLPLDTSATVGWDTGGMYLAPEGDEQ